MTTDALQALLDKEAIRDCLYAYCRGTDRQDEAALRATYWPDATDSHGPYQGPASGFIDWALDTLRKGERSVHLVGNIGIHLNGHLAAVESYFLAIQRAPNPAGQQAEIMLTGRYLDLFEKRGSEWRVKERAVVYDWLKHLGVPEGTETERFGQRQPFGKPYPSDVWYSVLAKAGL